MNTVAAVPGRIISTVLHHVDLEQRTCSAATMPVDASDLERYLAELLDEVHDKPQKREYRLADLTTQFGTSLAQFFSLQDFSKSIHAESLAQRLLRIELDTEAKYGHLNTTGTGHLKKGSFLQFMYRESGTFHYLGVKVEHQSFLDEADFKRKIGLGETQKIYKACKVSFDNAGAFGSAVVYDTNSRPSTYWWREFWELIEQRTDAHNTETAIKEVVRVLGPLKQISPIDYSLLRNAAIAAFKQAGQMDFGQFVDNTFANYQPTIPEVSDRLNNIVVKMRNLPAQKNFDSQFTLEPTAVPFRRQTVPLTTEISLSYNEGIQNLDEKIWASRTQDGQDVLVVKATATASNRFKFKAME
ncbi:hypothetical protein ACM7KD_23140 [Pseudomonas aeruginosa]|uniref:hypothetical protein n=1 Tax=Pseudomonas aeruginosa TaxID=287 RepID=UPI0013C403B9|nr:hypothetical protein [Pseudomonas aeruginosa]